MGKRPYNCRLVTSTMPNTPSQKVLFFDTLTTGPSPKKHSIWSMAGIITEIVPHDAIYTIEQFSFLAAPLKEELKTRTSIQGGMTATELDELPQADRVHNQILVPFLGPPSRNKIIVAGYNSNLDISFLRKWFDLRNDRLFGALFYHQPIDIITTVLESIIEGSNIKTPLNMNRVAEFLNISRETELPTMALSNAQLALQIYASLKGLDVRKSDEMKGGD